MNSRSEGIFSKNRCRNGFRRNKVDTMYATYDVHKQWNVHDMCADL